VRNSESSFLDLIYYHSPVASLIRNKYCWPNNVDSLCRHTVPLQNTNRPSAREIQVSSTGVKPEAEHARKQFLQIISGVRKYKNGSLFPKFGNVVQSDHLVIDTTTSALGWHAVFRISNTPT
jgi:hypothetical protein